MLTDEGCRTRRQRFLEQWRPTEPVVLAHPIHLRYFVNFYVEPISQHADFGGVLVLLPDGASELYYDGKLAAAAAQAWVDRRIAIPWYDGQSPPRGERPLLLHDIMQRFGGRIHDALTDAAAPRLFELTSRLRRRKDPDEIALLRRCMEATAAGHDWARRHIRPGMSELDVYASVARAVYRYLGHWAVVYGDFTVGNRHKRGGPPTPHTLQPGETFILDFSVVLQGYRSDFTNTLIVGGEPSAEQRHLFALCCMALEAGEQWLRPGTPCQAVYDAISQVFAAAGVAEYFPTHAGHGLGLMHPEPPFIVRHSTDVLQPGDVVTLEPGLYVGSNGIRIEHNYLITEAGCVRLSQHLLSLI